MVEDLVWKKKSNTTFRYVMLFAIRLAEVLIASIIPSVIGLVTVIITPKERVMMVMEALSLMAFSCLNALFWVRYVKHRSARKEFYVMNGIVYLLYIVLSALSYMSKDAYLYSILFSNLRGLELFGFGTVSSMIISHIILIITMIVCEMVARVYYKYVARKTAENQAEAAEIKPEHTQPEQGHELVKFLTIDEINDEIEREVAEAKQVIEDASVRDTDKNWDMEMVQGEDGDIIETTPFDPDNDIDSDDYVSEEYARQEMQDTMNYSTDSLWNQDIYKGNEPVYDYDDEEYSMEMFEEDTSFWGEDTFEIEQSKMEYEDEDDEEFGTNAFGEYDADNLWGNIKQGK